jgi:hypothetical protein
LSLSGMSGNGAVTDQIKPAAARNGAGKLSFVNDVSQVAAGLEGFRGLFRCPKQREQTATRDEASLANRSSVARARRRRLSTHE